MNLFPLPPCRDYNQSNLVDEISIWFDRHAAKVEELTRVRFVVVARLATSLACVAIDLNVSLFCLTKLRAKVALNTLRKV